MPRKQCAVPHCRNHVPLGTKYCDKHNGYGDREYNRRVRYSKPNSKYSMFYHTPEWRNARAIQLYDTPYCEVCASHGRITQAQMVHHKVEIRTTEGWEHRLDPEYLESICYSCHNAIEHKHSNKNKLRGK